MLLPEYWNHGYAMEIVGHLLALARQHPQVQKVSGLTDPDNLPSQKVLTKNGTYLLNEICMLRKTAPRCLFTAL